MGEFIGVLLLVTVPALGFLGKSWWWVFGAALIGLFGYWSMRPMVFSRMEQESIARRSIWPFATYMAVQYATQLLTWTLLFLAGRGISLLFSA